jgi:hypothetical protein
MQTKLSLLFDAYIKPTRPRIIRDGRVLKKGKGRKKLLVIAVTERDMATCSQSVALGTSSIKGKATGNRQQIWQDTTIQV